MQNNSAYIVTVDENDKVLGFEDKAKCHEGEGILHRGFLVMLFCESGRLLLAKRSGAKRLWPGYWDGTIASHVSQGEDYLLASKRRLVEEIGIHTEKVEFLFKFCYKVRYKEVGTEHEVCAVMRTNSIHESAVIPNREEISDIRAVDLWALADEARRRPYEFTPWFLLAMQRLCAAGQENRI